MFRVIIFKCCVDETAKLVSEVAWISRNPTICFIIGKPESYPCQTCGRLNLVTRITRTVKFLASITDLSKLQSWLQPKASIPTQWIFVLDGALAEYVISGTKVKQNRHCNWRVLKITSVTVLNLHVFPTLLVLHAHHSFHYLPYKFITWHACARGAVIGVYLCRYRQWRGTKVTILSRDLGVLARCHD